MGLRWAEGRGRTRSSFGLFSRRALLGASMARGGSRRLCSPIFLSIFSATTSLAGNPRTSVSAGKKIGSDDAHRRSNEAGGSLHRRLAVRDSGRHQRDGKGIASGSRPRAKTRDGYDRWKGRRIRPGRRRQRGRFRARKASQEGSRRGRQWWLPGMGGGRGGFRRVGGALHQPQKTKFRPEVAPAARTRRFRREIN